MTLVITLDAPGAVHRRETSAVLVARCSTARESVRSGTGRYTRKDAPPGKGPFNLPCDHDLSTDVFPQVAGGSRLGVVTGAGVGP